MEYRKGPPRSPSETSDDRAYRKYLAEAGPVDIKPYYCDMCHKPFHLYDPYDLMVTDEDSIEVCEDCYFNIHD